MPFAVEEKSGVITVIDELSKYNRPMFDFEAMAVQENTNVTIVTNATVHVVDVQDERGVLLKYVEFDLMSVFNFDFCYYKLQVINVTMFIFSEEHTLRLNSQ